MKEYKRRRQELPEKEAERVRNYLISSGYEARIKTLEDTVAKLLTESNKDEIEP